MYKTIKQHIKNLSKENYLQLKDFCKYSKNLYNYGSYITRQYFFNNAKYIGLNNLMREVKDNENYKLLPAQSAQQIIRLIDKNYRSFFALLRKKAKGQYNEKVNIPHYKPKESYFNTIWIYQNSKISNNKIYLCSSREYSKNNNNKKGIKIPFTYDINGTIKQIQIIPRSNCKYFLLVINYEENKEENNYELDKNKYLSIDLGVDNFATYFTSIGHSFILSGKTIKSYNRYYNKQIAKIKSELKKKNNKDWSNKLEHLTEKRFNWINNYLNQCVKKIIDHCIEHKIRNILMGEAKGWKQNVKMRKENNQKFVMIPFGLFKQKLENKCKEYNINYELVDESHTSVCSAIDLETIEHHDKYLGRRTKRGLFRTKDKKLLNADVNGAINIMRKVVGDVVIKNNQPIRGLMFNPVKIEIF